MTPDQFDEFCEVIQATAELLPPRRPLSATALALFWAAVRDLDIEEVRRAISACVNNPDQGGQFMPTPSDLRKQLGGTTADAAAMAWSKVMRAARSIGAYTTVAFDDPFTHAAIADMGGWPAVCAFREDELPFREREFVAKYRAYRSRGADSISFPAKLIGLIDQHNVPRGHGAGDVALIGNRERAGRVMEHGKTRDWLQVTYTPGEGFKPGTAAQPRLGLLPVRKPGLLSADDRAAMAVAEAEIAARTPA